MRQGLRVFLVKDRLLHLRVRRFEGTFKQVPHHLVACVGFLRPGSSFGRRRKLVWQLLLPTKLILSVAHLLLESVDLLNVDVAILLLDVRPQHGAQLNHGYLLLHLLREYLGLLVGSERPRESNDIDAVSTCVPLVDPELNIVVVVELRLGRDIRVVGLLPLILVDLLELGVAASIPAICQISSTQAVPCILDRGIRRLRLFALPLLLPPHLLIEDPFIDDLLLHPDLEILDEFVMTVVVIVLFSFLAQGRFSCRLLGCPPRSLALEISLPSLFP